MPNYLYVNSGYKTDLDPFNDEDTFTFKLSGYLNYDGIIVGDDVRVVSADAHLDGNNLRGAIGITLQGDSTLEGEILITNFGMGIFGDGHANHIIGTGDGIEVASMAHVGVGVSGGATVAYVDVHGIGSPLDGNAFAFVGWNSGNKFWYDHAWDIAGKYETVGFAMNEGEIYGSSVFLREDHTGWSFAGWLYNVGIEKTTFAGGDYGIANLGFVELKDSSISGLKYDVLAQDTLHFRDLGGNALDVTGPYLTGTAEIDHLLGSTGDDFIAGRGERDVIYGGGGADTFAFSPGVMSICPDYIKATGDVIYLAYHTPDAVVTFDAVNHVMEVNGHDYVYLPYVNSLNEIEWTF